jgi:hypothetical protein
LSPPKYKVEVPFPRRVWALRTLQQACIHEFRACGVLIQNLQHLHSQRLYRTFRNVMQRCWLTKQRWINFHTLLPGCRPLTRYSKALQSSRHSGLPYADLLRPGLAKAQLWCTTVNSHGCSWRAICTDAQHQQLASLKEALHSSTTLWLCICLSAMQHTPEVTYCTSNASTKAVGYNPYLGLMCPQAVLCSTSCPTAQAARTKISLHDLTLPTQRTR